MNNAGAAGQVAVTDTSSRLVVPALSGLYRTAEPIFYAVLRVAFGVILITHGLPKVLGTGHGAMADPAGSAVNFIQNRLHLPAPVYFGYFVTSLESAGGALLSIGLLTRVIAPMVAIEMAAICFILGPTWVWLDRGMEYPLLMGFLALYISFRGGDRYSIDRWIGREV